MNGERGDTGMQLHRKVYKEFQKILLSPNSKAPTPVYIMTVFPTLYDPLPGHIALGTCFSYIKNSAKITIKAYASDPKASTWVWRIKERRCFLLRPYLGMKPADRGNAPHCIRQ